MADNYEEFLQHKRMRTVVIDSNILLILLKYQTGQSINKKEKSAVSLIEQFIRIRTKNITAHVLAEYSNLSKSRLGRYLFKDSKGYIAQFSEIDIDREEILNHKKIDDFGVTDIGLIKALTDDSVLITSDAPLYYYCMTNNRNAIKVDLD